MGDFNDDPFDSSIRSVLSTFDTAEPVVRDQALARGRGKKRLAHYLSRRPRLYNPSWNLVSPPSGPSGSYYYRSNWYVFDQVILSRGLLTGKAPRYVEGSLAVVAEPTVAAPDGSEIRVLTRSGRPSSFSIKSQRGVSDHLPLYFDIEL